MKAKTSLRKDRENCLNKIKQGNAEQNAADGKVSKILAKIIETRNSGFQQTDILKICREYMKLWIEYENPFSNSKYALSQMLRTHKEEYEKYVQIWESKSNEELLKVCNLH